MTRTRRVLTLLVVAFTLLWSPAAAGADPRPPRLVRDVEDGVRDDEFVLQLRQQCWLVWTTYRLAEAKIAFIDERLVRLATRDTYQRRVTTIWLRSHRDDAVRSSDVARQQAPDYNLAGALANRPDLAPLVGPYRPSPEVEVPFEFRRCYGPVSPHRSDSPALHPTPTASRSGSS